MTSLIVALYLADLSHDLRVVCLILGVLGVGMFVFTLFAIHDAYDSDDHKAMRIKWNIRRVTYFAVPLLVFGLLLPTQKVIYSYAGFRAAELVSETAFQNPRVEKILQVLDLKLDEMLKEKND